MTAAGVVLAAGSSRRMGRPKQLLPVGGRPLLERVVAEVCASRLDEVVVVLGAHAETIAGRVDLGRARALVNPDHARGLGSSVRAGLAALGPGVDLAVVVLGDQPGVTAALLDRLLELRAASGLPAAAFDFDGVLHPPVALPRALWGDLDALEGDVGCRALVRARPDLVARLPMDAGSRHPVDVDTPEDYERLTGRPPPP